jgi:RNA-directed DNA polymerase
MNKIKNNLYREIVKKGNILAALKEVGRTHGRNTPGPDGITYDKYINNNIDFIVKDVSRLLKHERATKPRILKITTDDKVRQIGVSNIRERVAQQSVKRILEPVIDPLMSPNSYGYRKGINPKKAVSLVAGHIYKGKGYDWRYIKLDFKNFFDSIKKHDVIKVLINNFGIRESKLISCLKRLIYGDVGISQGSILGTFLANIELHELDTRIDNITFDHFRSSCEWQKIRQGKWDVYRKGKIGLGYFRYSDDIILFTRTDTEEKELEKIIADYCNEFSLTLNDDKCIYGKLVGNDPIYYLGFMLKNGKEGLLIDVDSRQKFRTALKNKFRVFKKTKDANPLLRTIVGSMYYMDICTNIQWYIKYIETLFHTIVDNKRRNCIEMVKEGGARKYYLYTKDGKVIPFQPWELRKGTNVSMQKYVMEPRGSWNYSPYLNLDDYRYFPARMITYIPKLRKRQRDKCYITGEKLVIGNFDVHHIIPTEKGGKDDYKNLALITREAHRALHGLTDDSKFKDNPIFQKLKSRL